MRDSEFSLRGKIFDATCKILRFVKKFTNLIKMDLPSLHPVEVIYAPPPPRKKRKNIESARKERKKEDTIIACQNDWHKFKGNKSLAKNWSLKFLKFYNFCEFTI